MSLGKLLATGRSLAGGPSVGRYNVSSVNRLPKFGPARNPFASAEAKPAAEPDRPAGLAPIQVSTPVVADSPANTPFAPASSEFEQAQPGFQRGRRARIGPLKPAVMALVGRVRTLGLATASKAGALGGKLLGRVKRVRRQEPKSVIPRYGKPAVQGELSLDRVKVVRNDLEESDLEIVTAQTNTSTQVAPATAPATSNRGPVPPALKRLTNRMLGVKPG